MERVSSPRERAIEELKRRGGYGRHRHFLEAGIDPHVLAVLLAEGQLERIGRGLYRLAEPWSQHTGLVAATVAVPSAVICLLSALDYYGLTTTTPSEIHIAIPRKARPPRLEYPPVRVVRYGDRIFHYGITRQPVADGRSVPMYSREKTIADTFHFPELISRDIAVESLKSYLRQPNRSVDGLLDAADVCRVRPQLTSYLEVLL